MPLEPGTTIGDYQILGPLGAGGMGQVYKVQNLISNRTEAMKILLPDLDAQANQLQRFLREIQLQASLVHPNIASLYTAARIDNRLMMFMELVEGETLSVRLAKGPLPVAQALNYANQVLDALVYAYDRGVVHRNIKPSNIMLTAGGVAKLLDFGLAAVASDKRLTRSGQVVGSLYYMSPEQVRGEAPTHASDIYSMGLTLYEMLTGRRGIQGDSDFELMTAQLQHMPEPPGIVNPAVPQALSEIVLRAVAKTPEARFASAREFKAALEHYRQSIPPIESAPAPQTRAPKVAQPPQTARPVPARGGFPLLAIGGTIAGVAVLSIGGLLFYRSPQAGKPAEAPVVAVVPVASRPDLPAVQNPPVKVEPVPTPKAAAAAPATPKPAPPTQNAPEPRGGEPITPPSPPVTNTAKTAATPPAETPAPAPAVAPAAAVKSPEQLQAEEWARIRDTRDPAEIRGFLAKYPNGPTTLQATMRLADLEWETLRTGSNPASLRAFAARNPASAHTAEALETAARMELQRDVQAVLDRFQEAFSARDLKRVRALWPGASAESITRVSELFKKSRTIAFTLQPQGAVRAGARQAEVVCRESLGYQDGSKPRQVDATVVVRLARAGDGWVIESLTSTGTPSLYQPF